MADGRILLDTNVVFRAAFEPSRLSQRVRDALISREMQRLISPISTNELAIKSGRGKLIFPAPARIWIADLMKSLRATELPLTHEHASLIEHLPWHHQDPFDRLLIAQALAEDVPILSSDRVFDIYGVTRIW